jgi:FkbM family methyltransferase
MSATGTGPDWGHYRPRGLAAVGIGLTRRRVVRGALRRFVGGRVSGMQPCFDVEIDGLKMRCMAEDNYTEWGLVFTGGRQDRCGRDTILSELGPGDVFVDVGANCGTYSLFAARRVGPRGSVIAVEPMPEMLERLHFNVRANGFANVQIFETAVGPRPGTATLFVDEERRGHSSLAALDGATPTTVPVTPLLAIVGQAGVERIDALKIDIEGYEDRALLPFMASAPRSLWPRRIFMETTWRSRWEADCISGLVEAGYRIAWQGRGDALLELPPGA